eukprot:5680843-Prymnesium_polylepis.1
MAHCGQRFLFVSALLGYASAVQTQTLYGAEARAAARAVRAGAVRPTSGGNQPAPLRATPPPPQTMPTQAAPVQGGSLRTWSHSSPVREHHVALGTDGRPLSSTVEMWDGPGNTPVSMRTWSMDGQERPVRAVIRGRGTPSTVAIRNTGPMEFPATGSVADGVPGDVAAGPPAEAKQPPADGDITLWGQFRAQAAARKPDQRIQGGAEQTYPLHWSVDSVRIHITSEGYPVYVRIDILQGPNTVRQGIELYSDDGREKPVSYVLETPGYGCVVQIINTGPMEYPVTAAVVPHAVSTEPSAGDGDAAVFGGGGSRRRSRYDVPPNGGREDGRSCHEGGRYEGVRGSWVHNDPTTVY